MIAIPGFVVKKFYVAGSLKRLAEGVEFKLKNRVTPGVITQVYGIGLDGELLEPERIVFDLPTGQVKAVDISKESPVNVPLHMEARCFLEGAEPGSELVTVHFDMSILGLGRLNLKVKDSFS